MVSFKGAHFVKDIILTCVRWYVAYPLSHRHVEELMQERGVSVDHATINRWVLKYSPQLKAAFHRHKRPVWISWHLDETYIKVKGQWYYLYRAVDKTGQTIDFLLTEQRDQQAAKRFLTKAIRRHGMPEKITIDGSEANAAAIRGYNEEHDTAIVIRQVKYLNNRVEQDHRAVKRVTRPMLGFKPFGAAQDTLAGVELMHMLKKGQMVGAEGEEGLTLSVGLTTSSLKICDKAHQAPCCGIPRLTRHRREAAGERQLRQPCPLREEQCALRHDQCLRLPLRGRLESPHELVGTTHRQGQQLHP
jgi:putative transposase